MQLFTTLRGLLLLFAALSCVLGFKAPPLGQAAFERQVKPQVTSIGVQIVARASGTAPVATDPVATNPVATSPVQTEPPPVTASQSPTQVGGSASVVTSPGGGASTSPSADCNGGAVSFNGACCPTVLTCGGVAVCTSACAVPSMSPTSTSISISISISISSSQAPILSTSSPAVTSTSPSPIHQTSTSLLPAQVTVTTTPTPAPSPSPAASPNTQTQTQLQTLTIAPSPTAAQSPNPNSPTGNSFTIPTTVAYQTTTSYAPKTLTITNAAGTSTLLTSTPLLVLIAPTSPVPVVNHLSLSTGAKAGIGVGIASVFLILLALLLFLIFRRRKRGESGSGTGGEGGDAVLGGIPVGEKKEDGRQSFPPPYPGSPTFRRDPPPRVPLRRPTMELDASKATEVGGWGNRNEGGRGDGRDMEIVEVDGEGQGVGRVSSWGSARSPPPVRVDGWGEVGRDEIVEAQGDQVRYELSGTGRYSEMSGEGVFRGHEIGGYRQ